jgi:hypothetical protein
MDDNIVPFKPKPPVDPRLATLARLQRISTDSSQMFEVRVMAGLQAARIEEDMRWERARRILRSLVAG